jgi:GxxExxY protein
MNHKEHKEHKEHEGVHTQGGHLPIPEKTENIVRDVIAAAIAVHRQLGPGFIEAVYHRALRVELGSRNVQFEIEKPVAIFYRGERLCEHRLDLVIAASVIVEVKAVRKVRPVHQAQLLSYMKASSCRVGLLMNFNVPRLVDGLQRFVR